jgi:hypothetical protein
MAGECNTYSCGDLPEHTLVTCGDKVQGGGVKAYIFACDSTTEFDDTATIPTDIATDIAAGRAALFQNLQIGVPQGSPVNTSSAYVAGQTPDVATYDFAGTYLDANVNSANDTAYAALNVTSGLVVRALLVNLVGSDNWVLCIGDNGIKFIGTNVVPDNDGDYVHYNFTFNYRKATGINPTLNIAGL